MQKLHDAAQVSDQCKLLSPANLKYVMAVATALKFAQDTADAKSSKPPKDQNRPV